MSGSTSTTTAAIAGAGSLQPAFASSRWTTASSTLPAKPLYNISLAPGSYSVRLLFANIFSGTSAPGKRVFDVYLNGAPALSSFDIVAAAPGDKTAYSTVRSV